MIVSEEKDFCFVIMGNDQNGVIPLLPVYTSAEAFCWKTHLSFFFQSLPSQAGVVNLGHVFCILELGCLLSV